MHDTSAGRREPFLAHEQRERAFAVAMLVVVNVVAILGMLLSLYLLYPVSRPPGWVTSAALGFLLGEAWWFAIWFSLSGSTLRFRIALVLVALVLHSIGHNFLIRYCAVLAMRWGTPSMNAAFSWGDSFSLASREFNEGLCFIVLIYAVLLPIRHFSGIVVATVDPPKEAGHSRGQFRIQDWMIWATVVAAPLALTSMTDMRRGDGGVPLLMTRIMTSAPGFLFALPLFLASLHQRRAAVWTVLALLGVAITGIGGCEVVRFMEPRADFEWRSSLTFLALSSVVICSNNIVLRALGFRLRRVSHAPCSEGSHP